MSPARRGIAAALVFVALQGALAVAQSAPAAPGYHVQPFTPDLQRSFSAGQIAVLEKLNRRDAEHLFRLAEVVAPDLWTEDELSYSPLPRTWPWAAAHPKALVVDQPSQVFGAYEYGELVRWGPVSTGREETPTPSGLFNLTWRSRSRRSTDNAAWILNWYFNFVNSRGVSFHEFELPGRPASHACVRLLTRDAQWIYEWGQQWQITKDGRTIVTPGTPVAIVGTYDFRQPPPWLDLGWLKTTVNLPEGF